MSVERRGDGLMSGIAVDVEIRVRDVGEDECFGGILIFVE